MKKIATVTSTGLQRGRTIRQNTPNVEQPSMTAASSNSRGSPRINWTIKKTKKGTPPTKAGTINGKNVFTQPRLLNRMYCGINVTCIGSIRVPNKHANNIFLKRKFKRAKPKATNDEENNAPSTFIPDTKRELRKKTSKPILPKPSHPLE